MRTTDLFKEFKGVSKAEWLAKVIVDQKGAPIEKLEWDFEGANMSPFYHSEDLQESKRGINSQARNNSWQIGEHFDTSDAIAANKSLINALELGVTAVHVGIRNANERHLNQIFSGIQHEWISTHFDLANSDDALQVIRSFCNVLKEKGQDALQVIGSVRLNIGDESYWEILKDVFASLPKFRVHLNPSSVGERDSAKVLLDILSKTYDFFQKGQEQNIALSLLFEKMHYQIELGDDYYKNIVLLRSARLLLAQLCSTYKVSFESSVSIETWLKKSAQSEDVNYNLIKNTSQILGAVIGGVDYVYSTCDDVDSKSEDVENRINRNISHVLQLESYMDRVVDPAAGSYFFESMTDQLCKKVWQQFQNRVDA